MATAMIELFQPRGKRPGLALTLSVVTPVMVCA